jgi:hypothetical protein
MLDCSLFQTPFLMLLRMHKVFMRCLEWRVLDSRHAPCWGKCRSSESATSSMTATMPLLTMTTCGEHGAGRRGQDSGSFRLGPVNTKACAIVAHRALGENALQDRCKTWQNDVAHSWILVVRKLIFLANVTHVCVLHAGRWLSGLSEASSRKYVCIAFPAEMAVAAAFTSSCRCPPRAGGDACVH